MTELTCRSEEMGTAAVVRVEGDLNLATAPILRSAAHQCLAGHPTAVVVEMSAARVRNDLALAAFPALARATAAVAGAPLLVCAPCEIRDKLEQLPLRPWLPVYRELPDALEAVSRRVPPHRVQRWLPGTPAAAQLARQATRAACHDWSLEHLADRASVVVTELVANVVLHARTDMGVSVIALDRNLHVSVRDGSQEPPLPRLPSENVPGGRGLLVVAALTEAWGIAPTSDGKVVWATLPIWSAPD